ncbi:hypothetical protein [Rhodospirillum sp. A1_3_36]|uniref:hypothetical protein n=1 Tax=Rhodospirillum sp. A1_3_36 TaxID=3391666 RepID=UPI0039A65C20
MKKILTLLSSSLSCFVLFFVCMRNIHAENVISGCQFNKPEYATRVLSKDIYIYRAPFDTFDRKKGWDYYEKFERKERYHLHMNGQYSDGTFWATGEEPTAFRFAFSVPSGGPPAPYGHRPRFYWVDEVKGIFHGQLWADLKSSTMYAYRPLSIPLGSPVLYRVSGPEGSFHGATPIVFQRKDDRTGELYDVEDENGDYQKKDYFVVEDEIEIKYFIYCYSYSSKNAQLFCTISSRYDKSHYDFRISRSKIEHWMEYDALVRELFRCSLTKFESGGEGE